MTLADYFAIGVLIVSTGWAGRWFLMTYPVVTKAKASPSAIRSPSNRRPNCVIRHFSNSISLTHMRRGASRPALPRCQETSPEGGVLPQS